MKTLVLLILAGFLCASPDLLAAQPENIKEAKDRADSIIDKLREDVWGVQASYIAENGRYWQAARVDCSKDELSKAHTDEESWSEMGISPKTEDFPVNLEIHNYDGPSGKGYLIIGNFTFAGEKWARAEGFGPEKRSVAWTRLPSD